jgi:hypothetical protein
MGVYMPDAKIISNIVRAEKRAVSNLKLFEASLRDVSVFDNSYFLQKRKIVDNRININVNIPM